MDEMNAGGLRDVFEADGGRFGILILPGARSVLRAVRGSRGEAKRGAAK
jgi:hypothetical protein